MSFILATALYSFPTEKIQSMVDFELSCRIRSLGKLKKQKHATPKKKVADGCHRYPIITRRPPPTVPYISYNEPPQLVQMLSVICGEKAAAAALIAAVLRVSQH